MCWVWLIVLFIAAFDIKKRKKRGKADGASLFRLSVFCCILNIISMTVEIVSSILISWREKSIVLAMIEVHDIPDFNVESISSCFILKH